MVAITSSRAGLAHAAAWAAGRRAAGYGNHPRPGRAGVRLGPRLHHVRGPVLPHPGGRGSLLRRKPAGRRGALRPLAHLRAAAGAPRAHLGVRRPLLRALLGAAGRGGGGGRAFPPEAVPGRRALRDGGGPARLGGRGAAADQPLRLRRPELTLVTTSVQRKLLVDLTRPGLCMAWIDWNSHMSVCISYISHHMYNSHILN